MSILLICAPKLKNLQVQWPKYVFCKHFFKMAFSAKKLCNHSITGRVWLVLIHVQVVWIKMLCSCYCVLLDAGIHNVYELRWDGITLLTLQWYTSDTYSTILPFWRKKISTSVRLIYKCIYSIYALYRELNITAVRDNIFYSILHCSLDQSWHNIIKIPHQSVEIPYLHCFVTSESQKVCDGPHFK